MGSMSLIRAGRREAFVRSCWIEVILRKLDADVIQVRTLYSLYLNRWIIIRRFAKKGLLLYTENRHDRIERMDVTK